MTFKWVQAAELVLRELAENEQNYAGLTNQELFDLICARNLVKLVGSTPINTMNARINLDIKKNSHTVFVKPSQGVFALKEYIHRSGGTVNNVNDSDAEDTSSPSLSITSSSTSPIQSTTALIRRHSDSRATKRTRAKSRLPSPSQSRRNSIRRLSAPTLLWRPTSRGVSPGSSAVSSDNEEEDDDEVSRRIHSDFSVDDDGDLDWNEADPDYVDHQKKQRSRVPSSQKISDNVTNSKPHEDYPLSPVSMDSWFGQSQSTASTATEPSSEDEPNEPMSSSIHPKLGYVPQDLLRLLSIQPLPITNPENEPPVPSNKLDKRSLFSEEITLSSPCVTPPRRASSTATTPLSLSSRVPQASASFPSCPLENSDDKQQNLGLEYLVIVASRHMSELQATTHRHQCVPHPNFLSTPYVWTQASPLQYLA